MAIYPEMPKWPATDMKKIYENRFVNAVKYARVIQGQAFERLYADKVRPGQRVYNFAIQE